MSPLSRLLATLGVVVLIAGLALPAAAQADTPTVSLDRTGTADGERLLVTGTGWSPGATVVVELCGREARGGSVDCDVANQQVAGVADDGRFRTELSVARPPSPCPCVVRALDQSGAAVGTAAIAVQGVPTVPLDDEVDLGRRLEISAAELSGGSWPEWFGAPPQRTLRLTVRNIGDVQVTDPALQVRVGRGSDPTGLVAAPDLGPIAPGVSATVEVPVELDPLSFGQYVVTVEADAFAEPAAARATTSAHPWGLIVLGVVVLQLLLLAGRNRVRERVERRHEPETDGSAPAPAEPGTGPSSVEPSADDQADGVGVTVA